MKKVWSGIAVLLVTALAGAASAASPKITHAHVTTAVRGIPTPLHCTVNPYGLLLTQTVARIRLSETGTPSTIPLKKSGADDYDCVVPVPMVEGIHAFWYSLDFSNEKGETSSTIWQRVLIVEAAGKGGGGAAAAATGGAGGGAGGGAAGAGAAGGGIIGNNPGTWIVGGILAVGAGVGINEIIDNNSGGDGSGGGGKSPPVSTNKPPARRPTVTRSPYDCTTLSGREQVSYMNLTVSNASPITIAVCQTCSNATISATGSWTASDSISNFNNPTCSADAPTLTLAKPRNTFVVNGTYTIDVFSNGQLIDSIPWPQDQDPFINFRPARPKTGK